MLTTPAPNRETTRLTFLRVYLLFT